jgi:hypothetical protein
MACCGNKQRTNKDYVRDLAVKYSKANEVDVIFHVFSLRGVGKKVYDFAEAGTKGIGSNGIVEVIKFRANKSKDILPDSKEFVGDSKGTKKSGNSTNREDGGKDGVAKPKMEQDNGSPKKKRGSSK